MNILSGLNTISLLSISQQLWSFSFLHCISQSSFPLIPGVKILSASGDLESLLFSQQSRVWFPCPKVLSSYIFTVLVLLVGLLVGILLPWYFPFRSVILYSSFSLFALTKAFLFSFCPTINWHQIITLPNSDSPQEALFFKPTASKVEASHSRRMASTARRPDWKAACLSRYGQQGRSSLMAPLAGCKSAGPEVEPLAVPWGLLYWLQWHIKGVLGSSWLPLPVLSPFSSSLPLLLHPTWPSPTSPSLLDLFKRVH